MIVKDLTYGFLRAPGALISNFRLISKPLWFGTLIDIDIFSKKGLETIFFVSSMVKIIGIEIDGLTIRQRTPQKQG